MFGSMMSSNTTTKNNKSLIGKRKNYFKKSDDFFSIDDINQQESLIDAKKFENKMTAEDYQEFLQKLATKKRKETIIQNFTIVLIQIILGVVFWIIFFK